MFQSFEIVDQDDSKSYVINLSQICRIFELEGHSKITMTDGKTHRIESERMIELRAAVGLPPV